MTHTLLTPQQTDDSGLAVVLTAAPAAGNVIAGTGNIILDVLNSSASSINVTITTGGTLEGTAVVDTVVAVAASARKLIGPFRPNLYNQPSGAASHAGQVVIDYSAVATVTVAAIQV